MPIIIYKEYNAVRQGAAIKNETCEKCGKPFSYEVQRTVQGSGSSPFFLTNAKAQRDAQTRAEAHLRLSLKYAVDLVPWPHCGWHQKKMVDAMLNGKLRWMRFFAWITLLGGSFFVLMLHAMFSDQGRRPHYPEKTSLLTAEAILILSWYGALRLRRIRVRKWDPNHRKIEANRE